MLTLYQIGYMWFGDAILNKIGIKKRLQTVCLFRRKKSRDSEKNTWHPKFNRIKSSQMMLGNQWEDRFGDKDFHRQFFVFSLLLLLYRRSACGSLNSDIIKKSDLSRGQTLTPTAFFMQKKAVETDASQPFLFKKKRRICYDDLGQTNPDGTHYEPQYP